MAFSAGTFIPLSAMANSNAARIFSYSSADAIATIKGSGYFNAASSKTGGLGLKDGDVILTDSATTTSFLKMAVDGDGVATLESANDFA
jgi:hypothetical protein